MLEVRVDYNRCTGHGLCELEAEDVFEVGSDGVVHLQTDQPAEEHREQIRSAAAVCPTAALTLLE
ncbi:ferredoxin [Pseudonocardia alni]|uniref:Ferredoxin n=2 Tax=Pseudonocardiaceae TaxID=2070 RepID=A0A852W854_PSEA5|nr:MULTISPECIES: ferredoxin [Pseudonocardia]NYG05367.1 ferredoxin [Pseudonocardia antarctica]PKB41393.1 ferredoxin [Pseudonocardia alni]